MILNLCDGILKWTTETLGKKKMVINFDCLHPVLSVASVMRYDEVQTGTEYGSEKYAMQS